MQSSSSLQIPSGMPSFSVGKVVSVKSTGRLHMGFFDLHGGLGRKFGSIGLALDAPVLKINAALGDTSEVIGSNAARGERMLNELLGCLSASHPNLKSGIKLNIEQHIPEHAGLGSGTQLALAIGTAVSYLYQLNLSTAEVARMLNRGNRSGIGIGAFDNGGLLIDGGRSSGKAMQAIKKMPPLLARYDFPPQWRILLILDHTQPGIHGDQEIAAFQQLPIFSEALAAHLCRHVLMQALPALVEQDLPAFGQSIQELQAHVGDYFAPAQGGRYASPKVSAVLEYLATTGCTCFGQSSWGPTGFAIFENLDEAEKYSQILQRQFTDPALGWQICSARNQGAEITYTRHSPAD
jgi:beta-ribofuranosylaminobenzene 5'-phosphate synthase